MSLWCRIFAASVCVLLGMPAGAAEVNPYQLREGDIVFSSSTLGQGLAIIAATGSPYTHCGVVLESDGKLMVLEAVQPVRLVTLDCFVARSRPGTFAARRLRLPPGRERYQKARRWAQDQIGRDYDLKFRWTDRKMYCSELVWKMYRKAGIKLCPPRQFKDYHLDEPEVRRIIEQRYGRIDDLPMDEKVVAPSDILASPLLAEVPKKS